jgi:hypothetical protein
MLPSFTDTIAAGSLEHAVDHGSIADSYAAFPSFHVGWVALSAVILAVTAGRSLTSTGRSLMLVLAVAAAATMTAAVVVTANHCVLDAVSRIGLGLASGSIAGLVHHQRSLAPSRNAGC